jgi:hypothetical protein
MASGARGLARYLTESTPSVVATQSKTGRNANQNAPTALALDLARGAPAAADHRPPPGLEAAASPAIEMMRGSGEPLRPDQRRAAPDPGDPRLNWVRIHDGLPAARMAQQLGALAFTSGTDIFLGDGPAQATTTAPRLLAHELAHALPAASQSPPPDKLPVQRATTIPEQLTEKTARWRISGRTFGFLGRDQIEWHFDTMVADYGDFDLVVVQPEGLRGTLTPKAIAEASVQVLLAAMDMPIKPGGRQALVDDVSGQIEQYGLASAAYMFVPVDANVVRIQFDPDVWQRYDQSLADAFKGQMVLSPLIAAGNLDGRPSGAPVPTSAAQQPVSTVPAWATAKVRAVKALIAETRVRPFAPADLPDDLSAEIDTGSGGARMRVWTWLGTQREHTTSRSIPMGRNDSLEDLLERAREAAQTALRGDEERRESAQAVKAAPAWARQLVADLVKRLAEARRHEPRATDVPDGVDLASPEPPTLRVWVERGEATTAQRNTGIVPVTEKSTVSELVPYVRALAAVLRQYERSSDTTPENLETNFDPAQVALGAFPARLIPQDLRADNITVTGAHNEFHMALDFERQYGTSGTLTDLYIASKLSAQYIHFYWEVYKVPPGLPLPEGATAAPQDWSRRWAWLNDTVNPPGDEKAGAAARTLVRNLLGVPVTATDDSELTTRVPVPDEPGDYLIRCHTAHAPIGEHHLKRLSSEAYYAVRVEPIKEVASSAASLRSTAITLANAELEAIAAALGGADISDNVRKALVAQRHFRQAYVERLQRREGQTLAGGTAEELAFARATLGELVKLANLLPDVLERARTEGVPPSSLIADPDLQQLYWFVIAERRTVEGYRAELEAQVKYLSGLLGRANEFQNELKGDSPYQYSVTAAFVSEITGHVYPLVFMLGEAPESYRTAGARSGAAIVPKVAYTLVDVTDRRTQKVYHGVSFAAEHAGHREAIDRTFEDFGEDATYGEGLIAARIPPGRVGTSDLNHPGTAVRHYRSHEGPLQKVLWALGIIAAVAGLAALAATGVGAPAAAAVLGLVASAAGAITSIHNINERSRRHTLAADSELALDIIGIIGVIPAAMGTKMALAARAAGFSRVTPVGKFLQFYGWAETGATVVLVPMQMADDIYKIEHDPHLTADQQKRLIAEVKLHGLQTGLMVVGSAAAARIGGVPHEAGSEEIAGLSRQTELMEREGFGRYNSLMDNGFVDHEGHWTAHALAEPPSVEAPPRPAVVNEPPRKLLPSEEARPAGIPVSSEPTQKPPAATKEPAAEAERPTTADEVGPPSTEKRSPDTVESEAPAEEPKAPSGNVSPSASDPGIERLRSRKADLDTELADLRKVRAKNNELQKAIDEQNARRTEAFNRSAKTAEERARKNEDMRAAVRLRDEAREKLAKQPSNAEIDKQIRTRENEAGRIDAQIDPRGRAPIPCFSGDTPVLTPSGPVAIEALAVEDIVLAHEGGRVVLRPVTTVHRNRTRHFYRIQVPGAEISATGRHLFWVDGRGWVAAAELVPGLRLHDVQAQPVTVENVDLVEGLDTSSYNLTVADASTYFVGPGVLVHNQGPVDLGFGGQWIIYRGTSPNPKFQGQVYIGQTTMYDKQGRPRGTGKRQDEHRTNALAELDALARVRELTAKEKQQREFFEFMSEVELVEVVKGIPSQELAEYLEQFNMDFERKNVGGEDSLMNRKEQIKRDVHMDEILEAIRSDERLAPYCPK